MGPDRYALQVVTGLKDTYHLTVRNSIWPILERQSALTPLSTSQNDLHSDTSHVELGDDGSFALKARGHRSFLSSLPEAFFGVSGKAWMFQFRQRPDMQFYGMGEKSTPFEKSDRTHRFWNTDVWADHGTSRARDQAYDPDYLSVPYVIIKRGNTYAGILIDNPFPSVISISPKLNIANQMMAVEHERPYFFLGGEDGPPSLYILFGPTLAELTEKLQALVGRPPLPPLWSLGHQQCRWGYRGTEDLHALADQFDRLEFPNDGLWLDIDYMDGYRSFTFNPDFFTEPEKEIASVQARGYKVVPILDPGIKRESDYAVYTSGQAAGAFCLNPAGTEFIGVVWPGYTVFPDFSLEKTRSWWADLVAKFVRMGPDGVWLDMNDPATGPVDCTAMLFQNGREPHAAYHNLYASLMAEATRQGLLLARPNQRPFLISRSGFTGSQQHTAHWTGDNWSNYHHLHMSIGKTLNLALSGMAINGPDVPGFGGNCTEALFIDWYKAGFLFPFFRNHSVRTSKPQEPWTFSKNALAISRHYVRLRYKLLPYLYNLFIRHCDTGEAILRPLFYDFADTRQLPLAHVNDQFMIGPYIMQAPFTVEGQRKRQIALPKGRWWRADKPGWSVGPALIQTQKLPATTPLFIREGALLPMQKGIAKNNHKNMVDIELLICLSEHFSGTVQSEYICDDGETFAYLNGARTHLRLEAFAQDGKVKLSITALKDGFGLVQFLPVTLVKFSEFILEAPSGRIELQSQPFNSDSFGASATFYSWRASPRKRTH